MKRARILALLITACMATTCFLGGTVARYQTGASVENLATAARWGVTVAAQGSLFGAKYANEANGNNPTTLDDANIISVQSTASSKLVAPGTKNDTGMTITLTGTPEVDVEVTVSVTVKDVFLKKADGTYIDYTNDDGETFDLGSDYYPIVFTLKNGAGTTLKTGTLTDIKAYFETLAGTYNANTNLSQIGAVGNNNDGTYILTWAWAIGDANNQQDTLLGNLAVGAPYTDGLNTANYSTEVSFDITITVAQVD